MPPRCRLADNRLKLRGHRQARSGQALILCRTVRAQPGLKRRISPHPGTPGPTAEGEPPAPTKGQPRASPPQSQSSQAPSSPAQRPVGTAAAETSNASGIAASQPAGVAIAPAKQRRARTMVLRVGALVGAGVAVGTVVALTQATPSKPPGAH